MLTVRSISSYTARAEDELDVRPDQLFYVLSTSADGRRYYLSTSSRMPFSRMARSGYAPVLLFAVVGDSAAPAEQLRSRKIGDNGNGNGNGAARPRPATRAQAKQQPASVVARPANNNNNSNNNNNNNNKGAGRPGGDPRRDRRADSRDVSAVGATCYVMRNDAVAVVDCSGLIGAQIVTYTRRRSGVAFRTKITMAGRAEFSVRRSYADFRRFDATTRRQHAGMRSFPFPASGVDGDAAAAALGKELNVYLQGVVRVHRHLVARGGPGLPFDDFVRPDGGAVAPEADLPVDAGGRRSPSATTSSPQQVRRDSGFASQAPSRKSSLRESDPPATRCAPPAQHVVPNGGGGGGAGHQAPAVPMPKPPPNAALGHRLAPLLEAAGPQTTHPRAYV